MGLGLLSLIYPYIPLIVYIGWIATCILTLMGNRLVGFYFLLFFHPFTYSLNKVHQYPFGNQVLDVVFIVLTLATFLYYKGRVYSPNLKPIILHIGVILFSLGFGFLIDHPLDFGPFGGHFFRLQIAKDYLTMPLLYWLTLTILQEKEFEKHTVFTVLFILFVVVVVDWRFWNSAKWHSHEHFSYGARDLAFGSLGANHLAAFVVEYTAVAISILLFESSKKIRLFMSAVILSSLYPIFFTYSRAGYIAALAVVVWNFLFKKKVLIITLIISIFVGGAVIRFVPQSVIERITMTETEEGEVESSAASRLVLWETGIELFKQHPITGIGYQMVPGFVEMNGLRNLHNYILQMLVETGMFGFGIFCYLFYSAFKSGWTLYQKAGNDFSRGLGMGFCGCVMAAIICNFFGDRWSFPQMQVYWWVLWAVCDSLNLSSIQKDEI